MSVFRFRDFQYDSVERRLTRGGEWVELTPKAMDILEVFVGRPGELISRDEIIGKVWGGTLVEEGNLSVHISKLRKALGGSRDQRYLETVAGSGSGYRFTASIERSPNGNGTFHPTQDPVHTSNGIGHNGRDSEAVRLLDKGKHFFENINPTTIHKAIECLERSISYDPTNPDAYAYLVYAYRLMHSFGLLSVAETLKKLKGPMASMLEIGNESDKCLIGAGEIEMLLRADLRLAEGHFRKALELNPNSSLAHYRLGEVFAFSERHSLALEAAAKMINLGTYSPAAYVRISRLFYFLRSYEGSLVYLREVLDLEPKHFVALLFYGTVISELGRYDEAEAAISESYELHPNPESLAMLGYIFAIKGEDARVADAKDKITALYSTSPSFNCDIARMLLNLGDQAGFSYLERAVVARESDLVAIRVDPRWDRARTDRFLRIEKEYLGLNNKTASP